MIYYIATTGSQVYTKTIVKQLSSVFKGNVPWKFASENHYYGNETSLMTTSAIGNILIFKKN